MTILKPAPVSIKQFGFDRATSEFTAEISSTNGLGRVFDDAVDTGLTVVGATGKEVVFVVQEEHRNDERELTHWSLKSTCGSFDMVLWND